MSLVDTEEEYAGFENNSTVENKFLIREYTGTDKQLTEW